jgi:hypothetical protein
MIGNTLASAVAALVVEPGEAWALYEECLPRRTGRGLSFDPSYTLTTVLDALVAHGQRAPLLRFAKNIFDRLDGTEKVVLDKKLKEVASDWRTTGAPKRRPQPTPGDSDSYAIIQIIPLPQDAETKYQVLAWLILAGHPSRISLPCEEGVSRKSLDEIVDKIHQAIDARRRAVPRADICLELFLPDELFAARLDQCRVKVTALPDPIPLGQLSPVVLRWNERAVNRELRGDLSALKNRFQLLTATHGTFSPPIPHYDLSAKLDACAWVDPDRWKAIDVHVRLPHQTNLVLCLLTHAPRGSQEDLASCALRGLLTGGVPAVLWSREVDISGQSTAHIEMEKLVADGPISELRHRVFEARSSHRMKEHFSLLWEDPTRMPPYQRLSAPGKKGTIT